MTRKQIGHRVADVSFGKGYVECECGAVVHGADPEELALRFTEHRRKIYGKLWH
jgi:hypothetical protein